MGIQLGRQWLYEDQRKEEVPCMRVTPLHLIRAVAPMRCSLGRRHGGLLLGQLRRLVGEERLCAWWRHAGAASSEGCLLGLEPRPAAAVFQLGLALRGKLRRASSGLGGTEWPLSG